MKLEELSNKTILMFGKPRAFNEQEFSGEMEFYKVNIVDEYNENVIMVVDGKMMTPYEQNKSEELYELYSSRLEFTSIDILEKELARHIDPDTLLMSLKLSHDKDRLKSFIQNSCISDELFLRLLKMYSWGGENFFDNNDNRDVSAAIILRFYKNIERNHNVQYATSGLVHLISQTENESLIKEIFLLEPLQNSFDKDRGNSNYNILTAIATHSLAPNSVLKELIKKSNSYMKILISIRQDTDDEILTLLYETMDVEVHEALSHNSKLPAEIVQKFIKNDKYTNNLAKCMILDEELFKLFVDSFPQEVAKNESLTLEMQKKLLLLNKEDVLIALASNIEIDGEIILRLLKEEIIELKSELYKNPATPSDELEDAYEDAVNHISLAHNKNTPKHILSLLSKDSDINILYEIAKNPNTPVEVLYQLQLDARLARTVKENPVFGQHIQTENLGWL